MNSKSEVVPPFLCYLANETFINIVVRSDTFVKKFVCTPSSLLSGALMIYFLKVIFTVTTGLLTRQAHFLSLVVVD